MSDTPGREDGPTPTADADAGEPIAELAELRDEPSARFLAGVMDGVHRRQAGVQFAEVAWWGATGLLMEFLRALFKTLRPGDETEGGDLRNGKDL